MATEISATALLSFLKGPLSSAFSPSAIAPTMTGTAYIRRSFSAPTSATAIPLGDVATPGWCLIVNRDAINFVEVFTASAGVVALKILAGEFALFRFGVAAPALKANTAAVVVDYLLLDT